MNEPNIDSASSYSNKKRSRSGAFIILFLVLALLALMSIPVTRIVSYRISVDSGPDIVFKELSRSESYQEWFSDSMSGSREFSLQPKYDSLSVHYSVLNGSRKESHGVFRITPSPDGRSFLSNHETLQVRSLTNKLKYFFKPSSFKTNYNQRVDRLRQYLEDTRWESAGIKLSPSEIPAHYVVAFGDSIRKGSEEIQFIAYYNKIVNAMDESDFANASRPQSRFKITSGAKHFFQVGLPLKDSNTTVPAPLVKLEVPPCKIIVAAVKGNYTDVQGAMDVLKDWIRKNHLVSATHPWVEHKVIRRQDQLMVTDSLYIIQPVYFYPKK